MNQPSKQEIKQAINRMKRALNRFNTDEQYADAIKRCTALLLPVCSDLGDVSDAVGMIAMFAKENWSLKNEATSQSQSQNKIPASSEDK